MAHMSDIAHLQNIGMTFHPCKTVLRFVVKDFVAIRLDYVDSFDMGSEIQGFAT